MTCRKVRKLMPLATGGDLRPREAAAFQAHVEACPACREELEAFRAAMAGIKAAAKAESVGDWSEGEWSALMARVRAEAGRDWASSETAVRPAIGARWVAAAAAGASLGLIVLGLLFRGPSQQPAKGPGESDMAVAAAPGPQERVAITMVSPETGLQVVWFLDKNFDYEGERN